MILSVWLELSFVIAMKTFSFELLIMNLQILNLLKSELNHYETFDKSDKLSVCFELLVKYPSHEVPRHGGSMSVSVDAPLIWLQGIGVMLCHVPFSVILCVHDLLCYMFVCGGVWMHPRSEFVYDMCLYDFWWMWLCVLYTSFTTLVGLPYIYILW